MHGAPSNCHWTGTPLTATTAAQEEGTSPGGSRSDGVQAEVVQAALAVRDGAQLESIAATLASRVGTLYGEGTPAASAMRYEDPAQTAVLVQALAAASANPEAEFSHIKTARQRATALRDGWEAAALLAAAGDLNAVAGVRAVVTILAWACDSEERRKVLRHSYLSAVRRWCQLQDRDPATLTTLDLLTAGAAGAAGAAVACGPPDSEGDRRRWIRTPPARAGPASAARGSLLRRCRAAQVVFVVVVDVGSRRCSASSAVPATRAKSATAIGRPSAGRWIPRSASFSASHRFSATVGRLVGRC